MFRGCSILILLVAISSCATFQSPPVRKTFIAKDGTEIIELESPLQQELDRQLSTIRNQTAHTVYDSEAKIKALNETKKSRFIETLSGPFLFHTVKTQENLKKIAHQLYGDEKLWKLLQAWNIDLLSTPGSLKVGMKLKYLPKEHQYITRIKSRSETNRLPASDKK